MTAVAAAGKLAGARIDASGNLVDANGTVLASDPRLAGMAGCTVDKDGNIVDASGKVVGNVNDPVQDVLAAASFQANLAAAAAHMKLAGATIDANGNLVCSVQRDQPPLYQPGSVAPTFSVDE